MSPAIVLAAGASTRYGYANKLLVAYRGAPLLAHTLAALAGVARPIVVVTGYQSARIIAAIRRALPAMPGLRFVVNRDFRAGMAGSLHTGLRALPACFGRVLLCLGDMPGIDAGLVSRLRAHAGRGIDYVRPVYGRGPGHPVLLSRTLFAAILRHGGDRGARSVLAGVPATRRALVPARIASVCDCDTPGALRRLPHARADPTMYGYRPQQTPGLMF